MQHVASLTALVVALLCSLPAWGQKLIVNYSDIEVAPYQMGEGNTVPNPPGAMVELINLMGKELGLEIVLERAPQLRSLARLQRGEIDAAFMYSYAPERLRFGRYPIRDGKPDESVRLVYQSYVFYRLKGSAFQWDGTTITGLGDKGVGFNSTFSVGLALAKQGIKTDEAKTTEQNFKKLALGRIAAYAMQEHAADSYLARNPMPDVEKVGVPFESKAYYLLLSNQLLDRDPALADRIWTKLGKLRLVKLTELQRKYEP